MARRLIGAALVAAWLGPATLEAQSVPEDLLRRVGDAVQVFVDNFTNVVAEEEYQQRFRQRGPQRRLRSDFLLVAYPGQDKVLLTFRDVLEVDGRPVHDQQGRLMQLFLEPFEDAVRRAGEIQRAASRHSLERGRLMDPLQVVAYLQPPYQANFRFTQRGLEPALGSGVRELDLEQIVEPGTRQMPLRAKAWVAESSGRVLKTELRVGLGAGVRFTTTTFALDPVLGIDVPLEMRDSVPMAVDEEFQGVATYGNFRRFQVRTDQDIDVPAIDR